MNFSTTVSLDSLDLTFPSPNCPAEFSSATPTTCSGNPTAVTKAVNPPRLKLINKGEMNMFISTSDVTEDKKYRQYLLMERLLSLPMKEPTSNILHKSQISGEQKQYDDHELSYLFINSEANYILLINHHQRYVLKLLESASESYLSVQSCLELSHIKLRN